MKSAVVEKMEPETKRERLEEQMGVPEALYRYGLSLSHRKPDVIGESPFRLSTPPEEPLDRIPGKDESDRQNG